MADWLVQQATMTTGEKGAKRVRKCMKILLNIIATQHAVHGTHPRTFLALGRITDPYKRAKIFQLSDVIP